jgi:hypothetical protein
MVGLIIHEEANGGDAVLEIFAMSLLQNLSVDGVKRDDELFAFSGSAKVRFRRMLLSSKNEEGAARVFLRALRSCRFQLSGNLLCN